MNTDNDLQEVYKNHKSADLEQEIPLAADAAHLIAEYLDTAAIELIKNGVLEPFSICKEFEQMIITQLEEVAEDKKLTYETVSKILEKEGSPQQIVQDYIKERDPVTKPMLFGSSDQDKEERRIFRRNETTLNHSPIRIFLFSTVLFLIGMFQILSINPGSENYVDTTISFFIIAGIIYSGIELFSGLTGYTYIKVENYKKVRYFLKNNFLFVTSVTTIFAWMQPHYILQEILIFYFVTGISYIISTIRDHAPGLYPLKPKLEPWGKYFTFSRIFWFIAAGIFIFMILIYDPTDSLPVFIFILFLISMLLMLISNFFDIFRKYPVSPRKLWFSSLIFIFYFRMVIIDNSLNFGSILYILSALVIYIIELFLIFRSEIRQAKETSKIDYS